MRRSLLVALVALAVPAAAAAKGPSRAEISGPGLGKTVVVTGAEQPGTPLMNLAESAGFFPLAFGQSPDPTLRSRPKGTLGASYAVVYRVPGPDGTTSVIREDIYPYAKPAPVAYMKPGQPFWQGTRTHGGWFVGDPRAKSTLVDAGLPPRAPDGGGRHRWWIAGLLAGAVFVAAAAAVLVRRRPHGRAAPEPT